MFEVTSMPLLLTLAALALVLVNGGFVAGAFMVLPLRRAA